MKHGYVARDVWMGVVEQTRGGVSVAAGAARLLEVPLHGLGHAVVDHEAHVRLIHAHTERYSRADLTKD